jgi:DNA-binding PadR family transcriptional regulator
MSVPKVELVVLGLLAEEAMHGYDLLERFRQRSMGFWVEIGKASVYQALARLERKGSIAGRDRQSVSGPDRRVYRITRSGRARLDAGLAERFGVLAPYEDEAGTALGFADLLSAGEVRAALDARERSVSDLLEAVRGERAKALAGRGRGRIVGDALLDRQEALAEAELAWLKRSRSALVKRRR